MGLDKFLADPAVMCPKGCTLFAPTDAAFNSLLGALDLSAADFLDRTESLSKVPAWLHPACGLLNLCMLPDCLLHYCLTVCCISA